jgi:hypothetical protein
VPHPTSSVQPAETCAHPRNVGASRLLHRPTYGSLASPLFQASALVTHASFARGVATPAASSLTLLAARVLAFHASDSSRMRSQPPGADRCRR